MTSFYQNTAPSDSWSRSRLQEMQTGEDFIDHLKGAHPQTCPLTSPACFLHIFSNSVLHLLAKDASDHFLYFEMQVVRFFSLSNCLYIGLN